MNYNGIDLCYNSNRIKSIGANKNEANDIQ